MCVVGTSGGHRMRGPRVVDQEPGGLTVNDGGNLISGQVLLLTDLPHRC